ncbi:MAG: DUF4124 domain-containing protein, partial [Candidatus Dadabacteria bacterium]|nr:DUF4124 domain-containing protein [Candidatus Dadabacteria bacterium]
MWGVRNGISKKLYAGFVFSLIILSSVLLISPVYSQNIYQWTDENGVRHYSNTEAGVPEE